MPITRSNVGSLFGGTYNQKKKRKKTTEDGPVDKELKFKTDFAFDKHDDATKLIGTTARAPRDKVKKKTKESMKSAENNPSGPKFTGYWKGTDSGTPGKKMVGGGP